MTRCDLCGSEIPEGKRFCCDKHRSSWHNEHAPRGRVAGVRKLRDGSTSVTVHFAPNEPALKLNPKEEVYVGKT